VKNIKPPLLKRIFQIINFLRFYKKAAERHLNELSTHIGHISNSITLYTFMCHDNVAKSVANPKASQMSISEQTKLKTYFL